MTDAQKTLDALLQGASAGPQTFAPNSRYYGLPTATLTLADGRVLAYVTRRFLPAPESLAQIGQHVVVQGDRLDNLAAAYLGDPQQYWRLCDANGAVRPDELIEAIGRALRITLPAGVPAPEGGVR